MGYFYGMKEVDYIVVGLGLAGIAFCEELEKHNKSFVVVDGGSPGASRVSGGMYNPVILKRYTLPWRVEESMALVPSYYESLSAKLGQQISRRLPVLRVFSSIEDQNNWYSASDGKQLARFMETQIVKRDKPGIRASFHYGRVKESGWVNVPLLLDLYRDKLATDHKLLSKEFLHDEIHFENGYAVYQNIKVGHIVFAEGYGMKNNPFFNRLPLVGNKGEYITIRAAALEEDAAVKSHFFIIPLGKNLFKVGATFNWKDKEAETTGAARTEILEKLNKVITCDFEVVAQESGLRPTTGDRRPLLGTHPHYPNLSLLNGLGTRGIMMSPYLAQMLYAHLESGATLPVEVDIIRFKKKLKVEN